jgi:hypothetical protein
MNHSNESDITLLENVNGMLSTGTAIHTNLFLTCEFSDEQRISEVGKPPRLMEVSGELHTPAAMTPGKIVLIRQEAGWAPKTTQTRWRREKRVPLLGIEFRLS